MLMQPIRNSNSVELRSIMFSPVESHANPCAMTDNLSLARQEFSVGRFRHAIQFARYALARDSDDASSLELLGVSLCKRCDFCEGIDALERAALIQPLGRESQIELAIAYGCVGRQSLSRDLLMAAAISQHVTTAGLLSIAAGLEAIDEPRLAMEACRRAGKRSPDDADVHYQMGYYAQRCGHPTSVSEALIRHAIELDPRNVHYRVGLVSMLIRVGRKLEAIAVIECVVPARLNEVSCQCCLKRIANLFFDCDDLSRAKRCAERLAVLQDKPTSANKQNSSSPSISHRLMERHVAE